MRSRVLVVLLAVIGLGALGWYGYTVNRGGGGPGFEVRGPGPAGDRQPRGDAATPAASAASAASASSQGQGPAAPDRRGAAAGGSGAKGLVAGSPGAPSGGAPGGGPRGPATVEVGRVERVSLTEEAVAAGTLRANESVILRSEVAGRIAKVDFADGARVVRDAVLVALDASVVAAEVEQARAELGLAQANFQRTSELAERNFVSQSAKDQAGANLAVLEAKLKLAQARLAKSEIRAPFSGVMGLRNISAGDFVKDGADLALIEDVSSMKVDLRLPERYLAQLRRGQRIRIEVDSFPDRAFVATLDALDVQIDANGRSLIVRGRLPNNDGVLRSGMYARATVVLRENPAALMIPEEALIPQGSSSFVYRVADAKATRVQVSTGMRRDGRVEILKGLAAGDLVVTAGQLRLNRDVHDVRVVEPAGRQNGQNGPSAADAGAAGSGSSAGRANAAAVAPPGGARAGSGAGAGVGAAHAATPSGSAR
jgi:membrane fusion protein, multidrug efflux system